MSTRREPIGDDERSPGRFYYDLVIDQSGTWQFRLAGAGAVTAASEGSLRVQRQKVVAP